MSSESVCVGVGGGDAPPLSAPVLRPSFPLAGSGDNLGKDDSALFSMVTGIWRKLVSYRLLTSLVELMFCESATCRTDVKQTRF